MSVGLMELGGAVAGSALGRDRIRSGLEMDVERREGMAYEYLCHLEEAKNWRNNNIPAPAHGLLRLEIIV